MAEIVLDRVSKVYSGGVKGVDDLQFFDPESGLAIGHPGSTAA